jgi:hypothetical protein
MHIALGKRHVPLTTASGRRRVFRRFADMPISYTTPFETMSSLSRPRPTADGPDDAFGSSIWRRCRTG